MSHKNVRTVMNEFIHLHLFNNESYINFNKVSQEKCDIPEVDF